MTETSSAQAANAVERMEQDIVTEGLEYLIARSGGNSAAHGFHEDWPVDVDLENPGKDRDFQKAITEKLTLIMEEVIEAFGEVRDGREPLVTYFVDKKGLIGPAGGEYGTQAYGTLVAGKVAAFNFDAPQRETDIPLLKPEGLLVELADANIRISDLVYLLRGGDEYIKALHIKHEYNATRPFKHGRQF